MFAKELDNEQKNEKEGGESPSRKREHKGAQREKWPPMSQQKQYTNNDRHIIEGPELHSKFRH